MPYLPKHLLYHLLSLFLMGLGGLLLWNLSLLNLLLGSLIFGSGCYLCLLSSHLEQQASKSEKFEGNRPHSDPHRSVYVDGGNYNEIQGNSITIQGNQIYLDQNLSEIATQIQDLIYELKKQGLNQKAAEQVIIKDFKAQAQRSRRVKKYLLQWRRELENPLSPKAINESVERIIKTVAGKSLNDATELDLINEPLAIKHRYQRLKELLSVGDWKQADEETVRLFLDLMPEKEYPYLYLDVDQISPKDLKALNQLWVKFSKGRFGFSVQQSIWKKILKHYDHSDFWVEDEAYINFMDCVGWEREEERIYYRDFEFSLKAPRGHFPALLTLCSSYFYLDFSRPSNYYHLNTEVFQDLMKRQYANNTFSLSWLRQFLLGD